MAHLDQRKNRWTNTAILLCDPGEELSLYHDAHNLFSPHAIEVRRANGAQLGFLTDELGEQLLRQTSRGYVYRVFIAEVTGDTPERPICGVNVLVVIASPKASPLDVLTYVNRIRSGG